MKKLFLPFFVLINLVSYSTIRTVSNLPATLAQYNTIQAAINASSTGDTVYVQGSPNNYAAFNITGKKIVVIGPGWSPNKNLPYTANIAGVVDFVGVASSGSELNGLIMLSSISFPSNTSLSDIKIIRNKFSQSQILSFGGGTATYTGFIFEGNYFNNCIIQNVSPTTNSLVNFLFHNNLFIDATGFDGNIDGFSSCTNVLFDHNLFYGAASGIRRVFNGAASLGLLLTNNIFVRRDAGFNCGNSIFNNNITFNAGTDPWTINSNVNGGGNVGNQDPQMFDQTSVNNGINNPLLDFTIAAGPANNSGSDGKDMGMLYDAAGSLNWTSSRTSYFPFIYSMNITNPTIPSGGTLNVLVVAKKDN
jgi:hypothetical protein